MNVHKRRKSYYIENHHCVNTSADFHFHFSSKILYFLYSASNPYSCIKKIEQKTDFLY